VLPPAEVARQITASRTALSRARRAIADDRERNVLHATVRREVDVLTCLIDESDRGVHWKIKSLIYEFQALARKMVN
jgi:hypothetical protein